MKTHSKIVVACETRWEWGRSFLRGIATFSDERGDWDCDFTLTNPLTRNEITRVNAAKGLLGAINTPMAARAVKQLRVPVVTLEAGGLGGSLPNVSSDTEGIGRMAAEHFMERGLRRFAYFQSLGMALGQMRGEAYERELQRHGFRCEWYPFQEGRRSITGITDVEHLRKWMKKLPKPIGVFCVGDARSREVASACKEEGFHVPEEVAILGVTNDEYICRLCQPQLSSIDPNGEKIGYEAARLLQEMIDGKRAPKKPVVVPALRVVVRQSSDLIAVENAKVSQAIRLIREQLSSGISVKELVRQMAVSRRGLEIAFREELGRTIHEEIAMARFRRAGQLLADGHLPLSRVAQLCGVSNSSQLNRLMRQQAGMTPQAYRLKLQRKAL